MIGDRSTGGGPQRTHVTIEFVEHPIYLPIEVWSFDIERSQITADELAQDLWKIARPGDDTPAQYHTIELRQSFVGWGTGGAAENAVLQIATGAAVAATYQAIKALFAKLRSSARDREWAPLERHEAEARIAWRIAEAFQIDDSSLRLIGEDHDVEHGRFAFTFSGPDGSTFTGEIGVIDGLPTTFRLTSTGAERRNRPEFPQRDD